MDGRDKELNWNKKRLEQTIDNDSSLACCLLVCGFLGGRRFGLHLRGIEYGQSIYVDDLGHRVVRLL